MIRIVDITVSGQSGLGDFSGSFAFEPGLQVVAASNRFGRELIGRLASRPYNIHQRLLLIPHGSRLPQFLERDSDRVRRHLHRERFGRNRCVQLDLRQLQ